LGAGVFHKHSGHGPYFLEMAPGNFQIAGTPLFSWSHRARQFFFWNPTLDFLLASKLVSWHCGFTMTQKEMASLGGMARARKLSALKRRSIALLGGEARSMKRERKWHRLDFKNRSAT